MVCTPLQGISVAIPLRQRYCMSISHRSVQCHCGQEVLQPGILLPEDYFEIADTDSSFPLSNADEYYNSLWGPKLADAEVKS